MTSQDSPWKGLTALRGLAARAGALKMAGIGAAAFTALAVAVGAGAAPSPFSPFSEVLGLGGEHGAAVSDAVHEAKDAALQEDGEDEDGEDSSGVGPAVSEAACEAAHDRSTLPEPAQNAPGAQEREAKDCTAKSEDEEEASEEEAGTEDAEILQDEDEEEFANHGAAVSQAVHDAKDSLEEGEKVGPAVSEAACEAAHDRSTLPESAQNAPGQQDRPVKDCTHPSNAGGEEEMAEADESAAGGAGGSGKATAPGQLKKQQ